MRKISALFLLTASAAAQFAPPGRERSFFNVSDRPDGPQLQFNATVEPPLADPAELKLGWGVLQDQPRGQVWHRFVYDVVHRQYFGYDLIVDKPRINLLTNLPIDSGSYRLTFAPLSLQPNQIEPKGLAPVALPSYPGPQIISPGDEIVVDLLSSTSGDRRKVVDHIQIAPMGGLSTHPFIGRIAAFSVFGKTARATYEKFGRVAGIEIAFDPDSLERLGEAAGKVNIAFSDVGVPEALNLIAMMTHTFWKPTIGTSILVTKDVPRPTSTGSPKNYSIDDGPVKFDFIGEVLINNQRFAGPTFFMMGPRNGATPWFSFPSRGRFILSLVPHKGFAKAGQIRDNTIYFQAAGGKYEITMNSSIVQGGGVWNLYVFHDARFNVSTVSAYLPSGLHSGQPMVIGDTDRLENLVK